MGVAGIKKRIRQYYKEFYVSKFEVLVEMDFFLEKKNNLPKEKKDK